MEKTHKKNIYVRGSKYSLPKIDHLNIKDDCFIIIDLDYYNYSNLSFFVTNAPAESASYCLNQKSTTYFHFDNNYKKISSNFDGLSFSGLIKTKNLDSFIFDDLIVYPLPKSLGDKKIVFLDRDGVLNIDTGYPHNPETLIINEKIISSLKKAKVKGYEFIVITNQSGIARGFFSESDYENCKIFLNKYFQDHDISILDWFHCPYLEDGKVDQFSHASIDRKPMPGMILKACEKHLIDLKSSIMIGDKRSDNILLPYLNFKLVNSSDYEFFV